MQSRGWWGNALAEERSTEEQLLQGPALDLDRRRTQALWPCAKPLRALPLVAHCRQALAGLRAPRMRLFVRFHLLYGVVLPAHLARLARWSLAPPYAPHLGVTLLLVICLLQRHRQTLSAQAVSCLWGGLPLGVIGGLLYLFGLYQPPPLSPHDGVALATLGLVTLWLGGFVTCFGLPGLRPVLGPLACLVVAIPLPDVVLSPLITTLQSASADVTEVLFTLAPFSVVREGFTFMLPGLTIEVAPECSSIRSSLALLLTGLVASQLWLRRWWSKAVLVLLIYPLAVFQNGLRIVTLCLLTLYVDEGFMTGALHTRGGAVFFGLALALLLSTLWVLRQLEGGRRGR